MKLSKIQLVWLLASSIIFSITSILYKDMEAEYGHRGPGGEYLIDVNDPYILMISVFRGLIGSAIIYALMLLFNASNK